MYILHPTSDSGTAIALYTILSFLALLSTNRNWLTTYKIVVVCSIPCQVLLRHSRSKNIFHDGSHPAGAEAETPKKMTLVRVNENPRQMGPFA